MTATTLAARPPAERRMRSIALPRNDRTMEAIPDSFELIAAWRRHLRAMGRAEGTIRLYTTGVNRLMIEVVEGSVATVTESHIDRMLEKLSVHHTARVQYARGFRSFFGFLLRRGLISTDPTLATEELSEPSHLPPVTLEEDELTRYMIAAANRSPRRAWAIMLTFSIGCRRGELAGIAPHDVFSDTVRLRSTKGGRVRDVELNDLARAAIEGLRPWWTEDSILGGVVPQTFTEWCHDAAVDSGLEHKVFRRPAHVLRASFITHLLRQGVPIHVVKALVGHRSIQTTQGYAPVASTEKRDAVNLLPFAS